MTASSVDFIALNSEYSRPASNGWGDGETDDTGSVVGRSAWVVLYVVAVVVILVLGALLVAEEDAEGTSEGSWGVVDELGVGLGMESVTVTVSQEVQGAAIRRRNKRGIYGIG